MAKRISKDIAAERLAELKAKQFTPKGRKDRIAKAVRTLQTLRLEFALDQETWKWIAQDATIEDF